MSDPKFETWETDDLKLASAIGLVGVPVLTMSDGARKLFILPRYGYAAAGVVPDAIALVKRYRSGELAKTEPAHPLLWGYQTLLNRERLLARVKDQQHNVLVRDPKTSGWRAMSRSAIVEENSPLSAFDEALKHARK